MRFNEIVYCFVIMLNMNFIESSETANEAMISIKPRGGGKISENGPM